jgi:hypothetical protein
MQEYVQERADPMFKKMVEVFKNRIAHFHDSGSLEEADAEAREFSRRYEKLGHDLKKEYLRSPQIKQIFDLPNTGPTFRKLLETMIENVANANFAPVLDEVKILMNKPHLRPKGD